MPRSGILPIQRFVQCPSEQRHPRPGSLVLGLVGIVAKVPSSRIALSIGSLVSVSGMGLLALAVGRHDLLIYLAATATAGAGYSLLFVGGLGIINAAGSSHHRGNVL
jgi:hypothetical protein